MASITNLLAFALAAVSAYALFHSSQSIPKLRTYESKAEKAAAWDKSAEKRLWDTRRTVGAGFAVTLVSFLSAVYYLLLISQGFGLRCIVWALVLAGGEHFTAMYMQSFWGNKGKVLMLDDYNDAISDTINVIGLSDVIAVGWGVMAVLKLVAL